MSQKFNQIINDLESRIDLFNQNKLSLSLKLNHAVQEDSEELITNKTRSHKTPSFEKTGWIPGALSYPWIISFLFIPEIIKNLI